MHRLDARAKLLAVLAYSVVLISFGRYEVVRLVPMSVLPLAMLAMGGVPLWFAIRRVLILCPFILMLALTAPFYDRQLQTMTMGPWQVAIAGGWLTSADIAVKFALGLTALTALMCTTPFSLLLEAMRRMGMPRMLVMVLAFLYRYIFVLIDEAMRIRRGRDFRGAALAPVGRRLGAAGGVIGSLLFRTLDRSERIALAMSARGYRGEATGLSRLRLRWPDAALLLLTAAYLLVCRWIL